MILNLKVKCLFGLIFNLISNLDASILIMVGLTSKESFFPVVVQKPDQSVQ